jgi:Rrf2 family transcriptional regulator, iron-sulfur cluster assembly transcription factor
MQLTLTRRGNYAIRALIDIAGHGPGTRRKAREIARDMQIPESYLPQVLAPLVQAGILAAVAGPDGGYALARNPDRISFLDIIEAAEGSLSVKECSMWGGPCDWRKACNLHGAWSRARDAMTDEMRRTTLIDLVEEGSRR